MPLPPKGFHRRCYKKSWEWWENSSGQILCKTSTSANEVRLPVQLCTLGLLLLRKEKNTCGVACESVVCVRAYMLGVMSSVGLGLGIFNVWWHLEGFFWWDTWKYGLTFCSVRTYRQTGRHIDWVRGVVMLILCCICTWLSGACCKTRNTNLDDCIYQDQQVSVVTIHACNHSTRFHIDIYFPTEFSL